MTDLVARVRLTALWAALMFLYIYADFFALFPQGHLEEIIAGKMGPFDVTQTSLFTAALLMALPAAMVALTPLLATTLCRWVNVGMGVLFSAVNVANVIGESWAFYLFYGALEFVLTASITVLAFVWLRPIAAPAQSEITPRD